MKFIIILLIGMMADLPPTPTLKIYSGFAEYYSTMPDTTFKKGEGVDFEGIKRSSISWKGKVVKLNKTIIFPNETIQDDDLGSHPKIYEQQSWACIEGRSSTSSGTAVRHFAVYLLDAQKRERPMLYKLPSLFGTCLGIRRDNKNRFVFDRATYRYENSADYPSGLTLTEYRIDGKQFIPTGHKAQTQFAEIDDVWKFTLKSEP